MLLDIIDRKLKYIGKELNKVNTIKVRASQYNHISDRYEKKKLHQRWNVIGIYKIQRDLYSAFLLMNCKDNLEEIDKDMCSNSFDHFRKLHDVEIQRLKMEQKTPISMGV